MPRSKLAGTLTLLGLLAAAPVEAADAVVGPPCDEVAFNVALGAVLLSGGGTITFNCGGGAILFFSYAKWIYANVTIDGGGVVTLSGGTVAPLFYVDPAGRLTLEDITLSDGFGGDFDGGAIYNDGTLVVSHSTFRNNRTTLTWSGGAIVSYGPVTITDSLFEGNQGANGGALYLRFAAAQASIRNTVFRGNSTLNTSAGLGGAILTWDGATADIEGGALYENTAPVGGAICNTAFGAQSSVIISGTSIHDNDATLGGAIYSVGRLTMSATVVASNTATLDGGGLYLTGTPQLGTAQISGGTISGNTAGRGGGVFLYTPHVAYLTDVNVRSNTAFVDGGGFYNFHARLTVDGGSVQANTAGSQGGGVHADGDPGLLHTELRLVDLSGNSAEAGGGTYQLGGVLRLDRSRVSHNSGSGAYAPGGVLEVFGTTLIGNRNTENYGGGVLIDLNGSGVVRNSTFTGNTAASKGGAVSTFGSLTLENVTISGNSAPQGGGLGVAPGAPVTLKNTIIANSPQGGNCDGTITFSKYSIASDNTCALFGPGDRNATDPQLTPLGAYGGPTPVFMLATGSPAIDGVLGNDAPATDQRGIGRPQGVGFDIGAVERTATDTDQPIDLIFRDGFEPDDILPS
jgi:predicted outer membrane repeat protein